MNLNNNTILITGGGSGIGLALAAELLKHNNKIIICGRNEDKLKQAKNIYPALEIIPCDISREDSVKELISKVQTSYTGLNLLINNAGLMKFWNIQSATADPGQQKDEILTNIFGTFQVTQSLVPILLKKENSAILNISSALAFAPLSAAPVYNATKAAVHSYSISLRQQLRHSSIKVFEVLPAAIETQMAVNMRDIIGIENNGPKMSPEKLARIIVNGLRNDTYEMRPGAAKVLYHLHRFLPSIAEMMIRKQSDKILSKL